MEQINWKRGGREEFASNGGNVPHLWKMTVGQRRMNAEAHQKGSSIQIFDARCPQIAADVHNQRCHGREHAEGQRRDRGREGEGGRR